MYGYIHVQKIHFTKDTKNEYKFFQTLTDIFRNLDTSYTIIDFIYKYVYNRHICN